MSVSFQHRSIDCEKCGPNVVGARAIGALGQYLCVRCLLEAKTRAEHSKLADVSPFHAWTL